MGRNKKPLTWVLSVDFFKKTGIALILLRFISLPFTVLTDKTESRYAEIGRKMVETGDYITPMVGYGEPFWGKPPLSFWSSALSYKIFGVNTFAAHLPHFLFLLAVIIMMYYFIKKNIDDLTASVSLVVLVSFTMYLYLMGGVMTDPALDFSITLALISMYNVLNGSDRIDNGQKYFNNFKLWGYLFFLCLGLSMLSKGPVGVILTCIPVFFYIIFKKKFMLALKRLPLIGGPLLMIFVFLPWYVMAELKTPGFIDYFIVGEHFKRFTQSGWSGDLYGRPSEGFTGMIFVYFLLMIFPWSVYLIVKLFNKNFRHTVFSKELIKNDFVFYMFLCTISPLLFFTLSKNIIVTYPLPALAPMSVLIAFWIIKSGEYIKKGIFKLFFALNASILVIMVFFEIFIPSLSLSALRSDKFVIDKYMNARAGQEPLIYYDISRPYSADFYTSGMALQINDIKNLASEVYKQGKVYVIARSARTGEFAGLKIRTITKNRENILLEVKSQ